MVGFLVASVQASKLLLSLLDTIITVKICLNETEYIGSVKDVFYFNFLMILVKHRDYLQKVDSDITLCCEAYQILKWPLFDLENGLTPKAFIETVEEDENTSLLVSINLENSVCQILSNKSSEEKNYQNRKRVIDGNRKRDNWMHN